MLDEKSTHGVNVQKLTGVLPLVGMTSQETHPWSGSAFLAIRRVCTGNVGIVWN